MLALRLGLVLDFSMHAAAVHMLPAGFLTDLLGIQRALWQPRRGEFRVEMQELQGNGGFIRLLRHF
jgi:hypothetical protein